MWVRVVFATSYPDIIPYLSPDWVIFTNSRRLVVNVSPAYGPAITVDWAVSNDAVRAGILRLQPNTCIMNWCSRHTTPTATTTPIQATSTARPTNPHNPYYSHNIYFLEM